MAPSDSTTRPAKGRPRDAAREAALIHAAQGLLVEVGYERLSMDAVAARAGASKATLYRRWPSKVDLVVAAVDAFGWDDPVPDTGSLRGDLVCLAQVWFDADQYRDSLFVRILTALPEDERLRQVYLTRLAGPREAALTAIIDRAVARGEARDSAAVGRLIGVLPGLAFQRLVVHRAPIDRAFIEGVLDDIVLPLLMPADTVR